ncbi:GTP-BINDING PROTEIN [Encephalitozoon cuniculi GB-M1]|uniref:GTP-BINDING PROTEIN n=2 Tax=Encephalitozoon cuniculi TaxID=6035 RepID=Q8SQQ1_ENCCU|nr:Rab GTPase [Encephalitozoon cuniculi GB-M1]KMV65496.1 Rab GTPase [Encephalitozoon cuniculi EcunIII-L]UYI26694.1 Ras-related protein Rab [Encephalitozoon cuniculi]CAD26988.2 GTP-BINDING PROTEIN [Encephalitozoon cuniculi GB-M1]
MRSTYKIVFLGSSNVGKTTLMSQYLHQEVQKSYGPTIGLDFVSTTIVVSGHRVRLQLWDTAGQERFNSIIPNYTRNSFLAIIVFDMKDKGSFESIDHWINTLTKANDSSGRRVRILIVGNKKDLSDEDTRGWYREAGNRKAKKHGGEYVETCAMKHEGIEDLVKAVDRLIEEDLESPMEEESTVRPESIRFTKRRGCC